MSEWRDQKKLGDAFLRLWERVPSGVCVAHVYSIEWVYFCEWYFVRSLSSFSFFYIRGFVLSLNVVRRTIHTRSVCVIRVSVNSWVEVVWFCHQPTYTHTHTLSNTHRRFHLYTVRPNEKREQANSSRMVTVILTYYLKLNSSSFYVSFCILRDTRI